DISRAVEIEQVVIDIISEDHSHLPEFLDNLGTWLNYRFDRNRQQQRTTPRPLNSISDRTRSEDGKSGDLTNSMSACEGGSLELIPDDDSQLPVGAFSGLRPGRVPATISERFGSSFLGPVQLTSEDNPTLPTMLSSLGTAFQYRYARTGNLPTLLKPLPHSRKLDPEIYQTSLKPSLCSGGRAASKSPGISPIFNEAISVRRKAVELTPDGHPTLHTMLNVLGNSLQNRFDRTGDLKDVSEAISVKERSVELAPDGDANLPSNLINLGVSYQSRFEATGNLSDIEEAISAQQLAVEFTPDGHAMLPARLGLLGNSVYSKAVSTASSDDLKSSISHYRSSAKCSAGSPRDRLEGARRWVGRLYRHFPRSPELLDACDVAVSLLALMAGLDETVRRRYTRILDVSGIAPDSAAIACALDRVDKAIEWLEQGRCLVWGQLSHLRTPLDQLRAHDPALARRIAEVSRNLETAGSSRDPVEADMAISTSISVEDARRAHVNLAKEWDDLLRTVRAIPGFSDFLRPSPCSPLLQHLPEGGSVVVINVDGIRCDAIALMAGLDDPLHIPLPNFSVEKAIGYRRILSSQLESQGLRGREASVDAGGRALRPQRKTQTQEGEQGLRDPILNMLGLPRIDPESQNVLPRIWWCPTGPLSMLPIHAAGIYGNRQCECVMDYAVSSYTPTITSLTDRVRDSRPISSNVSGLFLTCQPKAPGAGQIPGTVEEIEGVYAKAAQAGGRVLKLVGDEVTVGECLKHLEEFTSVHFACHASQNAADPLHSKFLFHKGSLDLGTIIQRHLKNADLAFLSACQTSTGDAQLSNEVVATMWSIEDRHAIDVANDFYDYLFSHSKAEAEGGRRRQCRLDGTISAARLDNSSASLLSWVPYVHFGL
ncbi:hypothetical protein FA13DRAFT_1736619, partial [Coprinellus micaceus]